MRQHFPVLQVVIPLLASFVVAMLRNPRIAWIVSFLVSIVLLVIACDLLSQVVDGRVLSYHLGGWEPPIGIEYRIDVFNGFMLVLVSFVNLLVVPFARFSVACEVPADRHCWFYSLYLLCLAGSFGILVTGDAFNAFVFVEIASISSYALIAMGRDPRGLVGAYQYLIFGTLGASFYVIAVGLLYIATGTLNFVDLTKQLAEVPSMYPVLAASAFLTVGLGIKFALFPLHTWLPNAYAYAPCAVSAFLSGTSTKVFVYLLLRFFFVVLGGSAAFTLSVISPVFLLLGTLALVVASVAAIFQDNVKRLLAYSSVAQIGYIVLGVGLASGLALQGAILHLFTHALAKVCLFLSIGAISYRIQDTHMEKLSGLAWRMPWTVGAFAIGAASLIGLPGTAGFLSKWYLIRAALEQEMYWALALIVGVSLLAVVYLGRVLEILYFRKPVDLGETASEVPLLMRVPMWLAALSCLYFGLHAAFPVRISGLASELLRMGTF